MATKKHTRRLVAPANSPRRIADIKAAADRLMDDMMGLSASLLCVARVLEHSAAIDESEDLSAARSVLYRGAAEASRLAECADGLSIDLFHAAKEVRT